MIPAAGLWWLSCLPEALVYERSCSQVGAAQASYLRRLLQRNRHSAYGRRYGFRHLRHVDDFRERVPLVRYEELEPWIARVAAGEAGVLTSEPVRLLEPTSGSRALKLIPYTASLKQEFQRGLAPWIANLYACRPGLFRGRAYWALTPPPHQPQRTGGGLPVGFEDDASYLGTWTARLVRSFLIRPDLNGDYLQNTLQALLFAPDLGLISVWSPTLVLLLLERLETDWEQWARHPDLRNRMRTGRLRDVWPRLACISCWAEANSAGPATELQRRFPGVYVQPKGLVATEGIVSLPLVDRGGSALAFRSHFFEFLDRNERSWLAHELQAGREYEVVLSTGGGLYRYRLGDRVTVTGWRRQCPLLRFLGRQGLISDHCGEKISSDCFSLPPLAGPAFLAYEQGGYVLFSSAPAEALQRAVSDCEQQLLESYHYALCRQLGQLRPVRGYQVAPEHGWEAFYARLRQLGRRPGDVKPEPLRLETDWSRYLPGRFLNTSLCS